jgi:leucyl aminopeptidase
MNITIKKRLVVRGIEAVVVPVYKGKGLQALTACYPELDASVRRYRFKGRSSESFAVDPGAGKPVIIIIGAGSAFNGKILDTVKCAGKTITLLRWHKVKKALVRFTGEAAISKKFWQNFIDYLYIGHYRFSAYLKPEKSVELKELGIYTDHKSSRGELSEELLERRQLISRSVDRARDLVNEPAGKATPEYIAAMARQIASMDTNLEISVLRKKELEMQEMRGTLAVGRSSPIEPAMVTLSYRPPAPLGTVALVGKGITFDSGGLNIKTGSYMHNMKSDMSGAAAVLCTLEAAAALKLPVALDGIVPLAENLVGQHAYKPGDIIRFKNKKTVEIINTDCEGRLLLADALILATEKKPQYIVELSTLTGAIASALGDGFAGVMGNHKALIGRLFSAGNNTGERLWQLPLPEDYRDSIKSKIADLKNGGYGKAYSITAGLFLKEFVDKLPFAHIDIAGTAFLTKPNIFYKQEGSTGFGVRLLIEFLESFTDADFR